MALKCIILFSYSERSEVSTQARESFRMASGRIFRVRQNFLSYSLQRLRPRARCHVLLIHKLWPPSRWSCKAYKLYRSARLCLPTNQCSRGQKRSLLLGPKLFVLSLMVKMLLAVACQLVYSSKEKTKETTPLSRDLHAKHKFNLQGLGRGNPKIIQIHHA